jgi:hypothetical protein
VLSALTLAIFSFDTADSVGAEEAERTPTLFSAVPDCCCSCCRDIWIALSISSSSVSNVATASFPLLLLLLPLSALLEAEAARVPAGLLRPGLKRLSEGLGLSPRKSWTA